MTNSRNLRLDDKLAEQLANDAKQTNVSENQYIENAIRNYLQNKTSQAEPSMRMIVLQYDGTCIKCGHKLERGQFALYGRGVGILCLDCQVIKFGDKALVAKYLKTREFKQIITALTNEADKLAEKIEAFQGYEKLIALYENQKRMTELVTKYLTEKIAQPDEREAFSEILLCKKEAEERIKDMEEYLKRVMDRKKLKWIKKTSEAQEA